MHSKLRPSPAMVVAVVALVGSLGGTSYAAASLAKNSVGTGQLKTGAVKVTDIANNAVSSSKVKNGSLLAVDFKAGQLPQGPARRRSRGRRRTVRRRRPAGPAGPAGPIGPSHAFLAAKDTHNVGIPQASHTVLTKPLEAGDYTFMASASIRNSSGIDGEFTCSILEPIGDLVDTLGAVTVSLENDEHAAVSIVGATHTDGTTVELNCDSTDGGQFATVSDARLVSTLVGAVE